MYPINPHYPTQQHARAAGALHDLFSRDPAVDSVLVMGSTARGMASPDSCLDIVVLYRTDGTGQPRERLEALWQAHATEPVYQEMQQVGVYAHVDLNFTDGQFDPACHPHGYTSGADEFELEVGNYLAYSAPLGQSGPYYQELCARWLPYYDEALRHERLAMVTGFCRNNLAHIPLYAPRGLYFQCFKRFYHAFEEFLQALFSSRRVYPIAYDKWVREEIVDILGLPELYARLPGLLEVRDFESQEIVAHARALEALLAEYGL